MASPVSASRRRTWCRASNRAATLSGAATQPTRWGLVFFALCLGWLAAYQYFKLPPAIPLLLERYAYSPVFAGSLMGGFACAGLLLSQWVGKKASTGATWPLLTAALALSTGGCLVSLALPSSVAMMTAGRVAEAFGFAVFSVLGPLLVTEASNPRDRPLATGLFATWLPVGQLAAAGVAAPSLPLGQWQLLWWLALGALIVMGLWTWRLRSELRAGWDSNSDSDDGSLTSSSTAATENVSAWLAGALFGLWSGQYIAFMTWLPQFLTASWELDVGNVVLSYAIVPATVIVFNVVAGWLMGAGVALAAILVPALVAQTGIWLLLPGIDSAATGVLALLAYGLLSGLIPTCLFSLPAAISAVPAGRARAFGVMLSGRNLGALVGPVLLPSILLVTANDWSSVPWVFGIWMGTAVLVSIQLAKKLRDGRLQ